MRISSLGVPNGLVHIVPYIYIHAYGYREGELRGTTDQRQQSVIYYVCLCISIDLDQFLILTYRLFKLDGPSKKASMYVHVLRLCTSTST